MKKLNIFLMLMILSLGIFGLTSCKENTNNPSETPVEPTPTPTPEKVQYALTISYPDGTSNTVKMDENTTISLNDYVIPFGNMVFEGFYKEETFETRVYTYTFTQNGKLYTKYVDEVIDTPTPEPTPTPTPEPHTCTFEETYTFDEVAHWKKCTSTECEEITTKENHNFVNEATEEYLKSEATNESAALYYSHCDTCNAKGNVFEYGDKLYQTYTLTVETNVENLSFTFSFKENVKIDYETVTKLIIEDTKVNGVYAFEDFYTNTTYETKFENEYLTENTTVYINLDKTTRELTFVAVGLNNNISKTISLNKNSMITESVLEDINTDNYYELMGWYLDKELTIPFEDFKLLENTTIYASYDAKMKIISYEFSEITYPTWYENNEYSDSDIYTLSVNVNLSEEPNELNAVLITNTDALIEMDSFVYDSTNSTATLYFVITANLVLENNKYLSIEGVKLTIDDEEFETLERDVIKTLIINLQDAIKQTSRLMQNSLKSDFASSVKHIDSQNFVWYDTLKATYDLYNYSSSFDEVLETNNYYNYITSNNYNYVSILDEINLNNVDVLCSDIIVNEDIYINNYDNYLNSIFSYENFMGRLDLNGYTIYFNFDGYNGNALFKNNYGEIFNGNIVIDGLRNSKNSNEVYNTLDYSSALLENNYGYIHDLKITVKNFGYNFTTNHNIDSVIGVNREYALVENCTFDLEMNYVGTKLDRIKNPLVTSNVGIFREVKGGSIYSHLLNGTDKQELKGLFVNINAFDSSEELQEEGLVSLSIADENLANTYYVNNEVSFGEDGYFVPYTLDTFYGGNYYFDGENYIRANSAVLNEKLSFNTVDVYLNTGYGYTNTNQLKNMLYFLYINDEEKYNNGPKVNVCEYGYLLPEFAMVSYDNCYVQRQLNNDECQYNGVCICESCVTVAAFTNSYLVLNCDLDSTNLRADEFYAIYDVINGIDTYNYKYATAYYNNGYAHNYTGVKPELKDEDSTNTNSEKSI